MGIPPELALNKTSNVMVARASARAISTTSRMVAIMSDQRHHTPTPWAICPNEPKWLITTVDEIKDDIICEAPSDPPIDLDNWAANAAFIVIAANSHQGLADEIASLRAQLAIAAGEIERLRQWQQARLEQHDQMQAEIVNLRAQLEAIEQDHVPKEFNDSNIRSAREFKERAEAAEAQLASARKALEECVLQIEYVHNKFSRTGSGEGVLARSRAVLSALTDD